MSKVVKLSSVMEREEKLKEIYEGLEEIKDQLTALIDEYEEEESHTGKAEELIEALDAPVSYTHLAYFINPELCKGFDSYVQIETEGISLGQSVVDSMNFYRKASNARVLTEVDVYGFFQIDVYKRQVTQSVYKIMV